MIGGRTLVTLALAATLAVPARAEERSSEPLTSTPGQPTENWVIDLGALPSAAAAPETASEPLAIHSPVPGPQRVRVTAVPAAPEALAPAAPLAPLGPSPPLADAGFQALPDNLLVIPPDTHGAVGPNHLLVTLNSQVHVQTRTGAAFPGFPKALSSFWGTTGVFDPRALYDPYADRWIVVSCDDARTNSSAVLVAASQTNDPTGLWWSERADADIPDTLWADYPSVGFNKNWVVVQVNLFTVAADDYDRSQIYIFERADLYDGPPTSYRFIEDFAGFTQVPAVTYDDTLDDLYLVEEWNPGLGALRLLKLSGPVGFESLSEVGFPLGPTWASVPPTPNFAPQSGSGTGIATNDARIQNLVFRNGKLWTTHTVFLPSAGPNRSSIQWWQIDPATAGVPQSGLIDDPSGTNFYAFPSIAVNTRDDALLGFSCFSAVRFPSGCYAFRGFGDSPGTFRDVATLKNGEAKYVKLNVKGVNRWGDYSATAVDPLNDTDLWTIQEYAMQPLVQDRWGTWWGHLALPPDITINDVTLAEGNVGNTNARFTISLSFPSTQTVTVDWVAADGTATLADSDFLPAGPLQVTFPPGVTAQTVDVPVVGDLKFEPNETFVVDLSNPVNAVITDPQGVGTILNDDGIPMISIDDVRVIEGNPPFTPAATFTVTLSNPSAFTVSVSWNTTDDTAGAPGDYQSGGGTVVFAPGSVSEPLSVLAVGDLSVEPNETFHVNLSAPSNGVIRRPRGVGTILDDDTTNPDVGFLTVVSDGDSAFGHNRVQWVNPVSGTPPTEIRIRFTQGPSCVAPTVAGGACLPADCAPISPVGPAGSPAFYDHNNLSLDTPYCYTVWAAYPGPVFSTGVSVEGHPFDATATKLKWKYATGTGTTGVAPPSIGFDGVFAVDNSGDLHAMDRSGTGGEWPTLPLPTWFPVDLNFPSQARNPVVPLSFGSRMFIGTQDGGVHAVDTQSGAVVWTTTLAPASGGAAPAGIFTAFGGEHDAILIGTSAADNNVFHALDPATGAVVDTFGPADGFPGIGRISGMAVVDYRRLPQNRVYFATLNTGAGDPRTLWCLELGLAGPVTFSFKWAVNVGNISGSPVLRNGRIYVGTDAGEVLSVRAADGLDIQTTGPLLDGPIKNFILPDRLSDAVYFSTTNKVWKMRDAGVWVPVWETSVIPNPSTPLFWPGTTHLFVGGGDGRLYQLDVSLADPGPTRRFVDLDFDPTGFEVGVPSLDIGFNVLHVGSVRGVFYAVQVPLP